jgi:hypothetical protein
MIDASWISNLKATAGPLCYVAFGSGLAWLIQRNEWGRQRRWELRREAVLDALRVYADLENALTELDSTYTVPLERCEDDARVAQESIQLNAMLQFRKMLFGI